MSKKGPQRRVDRIAGGRLCRPGGTETNERVEAVKEGAHGGTMGSAMRDV
jgi:hypothetical protein